MEDPGEKMKNERNDNLPNIPKERHDNEMHRDAEIHEKTIEKENFKEHCNDCD